MLAELASDMPRLLSDRDKFPRLFEGRSEQILASTAPEDEPYVMEVLQAFVDRSGINDQFYDTHVV